jgi:hypothetical protein
MPALLVERALDLARAEAGLALVHTRRVAVRAVSALLGTIVACAFAQLTLVLLVAWPVLARHVPLVNLLAGVLVSLVLAGAGATFAALTWAGVAREGRASAARAKASAPAEVKIDATPSSAGLPVAARGYDTPESRGATDLAERVGA